MTDLGARLLALRQDHGQSLQTVADSTGLSKTTVWDLEEGRSPRPAVRTVLALARHFGVSVGYLIGEPPADETDDPKLIGLFRDLKELCPADRATVAALVKHLRRAKD